MRVYVPLPDGLSAVRWADRYDRGEVPDRSPYGLHHLRDHGFDVSFSDRTLSPAGARVARSARYRTTGLELVETARDRAQLLRRSTDVVLCYDERTGIPAALQSNRGGRAPVVTGIGWLTSTAAASPAMRTIASRALPRAAGVWTQCSAMIPILETQWGVRGVRFVPVGIDTDFYPEQPWVDGPPTVVSAGEDRFRDHELLIAAVRVVRDEVPDVQLELATGLPTTMSADLGTLYTERMDGRMRDLYRRSSVVGIALRPTPTGSGLTVVLEAMASGRPVVVTDNPGMSDYVEHGVTGCLVPPDDTEAFARALRELLLDHDRAREMGRAAAARARELFTSRHMSAHLAEALRAVG